MLYRMLADTAAQRPNHPALVCGALRRTYSELLGNVNACSRELRSLGIGAGDCAVILLPNNPEFVITFFALAKLGATILPLNPLLKPHELQHYFRDSESSAVIADPACVANARGVIAAIGTPIKLIVTDASFPGASSLDPLVAGQLADEEMHIPFQGRVLFQYSSGSTGRPKRVSRTHSNLVCEAVNFTSTAHVSQEDTIFCMVPLYHAHGLGNCLLATVRSGATLAILEHRDTPFIFRRSEIASLVSLCGTTVLPGVPYMFDVLGDTPQDVAADWSTVRLCFSAGTALSREVFDKVLRRFGVPVRQLFGCTEAGSVSINLDDEPDCTCVGRPMNGIRIKIIDDNGIEVSTGMAGEVAFRSPALTRGYDNLPAINRQAFRDGYFLTGDLGHLDAFGRLYITGRKKLLIDTAGRKVDPTEIEEVIATHPAVRETVVLGVKGPYEGQIIKAFVVRSSSCQPEQILHHCRERLAEFKVPKLIEFRDEIPRSPLGKILRKDLA